MQITDPIADLLTRIRNAGMAGLKYTTIPASKVKIAMIKILEEEGFVRGHRLIRDNGQGKIKVALRYTKEGSHVIQGLERISKPSRRIYSASKELPKVRNGVGVAIVSTSRGVLSAEAARKINAGGEVLAYVW